MSQTTTLILLPQTSWQGNIANSQPYTVIGNSQPAAAYYLGNRDLQTVNLNVFNFTGNIVIEASLASTPDSTDWFKVFEIVANTNAPSNSAPQLASNASTYTNIEGNFVYLRAKIDNFTGGIVNFVKMSY